MTRDMRPMAQGDVLIVPVASVPQEAHPLVPRAGRLVLADGEATGHSHSIVATEDVELVSVSDQVDLWLRVPPTMRTALEAVAWTYDQKPEVYRTLSLRT